MVISYSSASSPSRSSSSRSSTTGNGKYSFALGTELRLIRELLDDVLVLLEFDDREGFSFDFVGTKTRDDDGDSLLPLPLRSRMADGVRLELPFDCLTLARFTREFELESTQDPPISVFSLACGVGIAAATHSSSSSKKPRSSSGTPNPTLTPSLAFAAFRNSLYCFFTNLDE